MECIVKKKQLILGMKQVLEFVDCTKQTSEADVLFRFRKNYIEIIGLSLYKAYIRKIDVDYMTEYEETDVCFKGTNIYTLSESLKSWSSSQIMIKINQKKDIPYYDIVFDNMDSSIRIEEQIRNYYEVERIIKDQTDTNVRVNNEIKLNLEVLRLINKIFKFKKGEINVVSFNFLKGQRFFQVIDRVHYSEWTHSNYNTELYFAGIG